MSTKPLRMLNDGCLQAHVGRDRSQINKFMNKIRNSHNKTITQNAGITRKKVCVAAATHLAMPKQCPLELVLYHFPVSVGIPGYHH